MSLVVWLPLNGDLTNQGLSNVTVTNNGATVDNNGKIGKCYRFDGDVYLNLSKGIDTTKDYSICYWFKEFANNTLSQFRVVYQCGNLIVGQYGELLDIYNNAGSGFDVFTKINDTTIWHHACFTFQSSENLVTIYIDGKYAISQTVTSIPTSDSYAIIGKRSNGTYLFQGNLNDVRIYDHCLSAKEVKELAKGMVLHYRLSGPGQENLVKNSNKKIISGDYAVTSYELSETLVLNQIYTITMKAKLTPDLKWIGIWSDGGGTNFAGCQARNENNFYKWTVTCNSSNATHNIFTIFASNNDVGVMQGNTPKTGTCEIEWIKLEKGSVATPWCPNPIDALYSAMGYNNNIEYDCSGYRRNGTKSGTITWDIDSPRYTTSYNYTDSATSIKLGDLSTIIPEGIFTFNIWFKKETNKWSSKAYETILGGPGGFELETKNSTSNSPIIFAYSWGGGAINYTLDTWHMLTMVRTSVDTKFYLDGELKLTGSAGTIPAGNYFIGAWRSALEQNYRGLLADARIYVTALSIEDIEELYHTAVIVDNTGKSYAYEYFEAQ